MKKKVDGGSSPYLQHVLDSASRVAFHDTLDPDQRLDLRVESI